MGKSSASKEEMGMRGGKMMMEKKNMPMKSKGGFPVVPKEHKGMDDLGYFTKPGTRRKGK